MREPEPEPVTDNDKCGDPENDGLADEERDTRELCVPVELAVCDAELP